MAETAHHHTEADDPTNVTNPEHARTTSSRRRSTPWSSARCCVFTGVTVVVAFIDLGWANPVIALFIACFKAVHRHPVLHAREVSVAADQDDDRLGLLHLPGADRHDSERLHQPFVGSLVEPQIALALRNSALRGFSPERLSLRCARPAAEIPSRWPLHPDSCPVASRVVARRARGRSRGIVVNSR